MQHNIIPENKQKLLDAIGDEKVVEKLLKNIEFKKNQEQIVQPMGFTNYNLWIQQDSLLSGGGFQCDFTTSSDIYTGMSIINTISNPLTWSIGGTTSNENLQMIRQMQIGTTPANARLQWRYNIMNGGGTFNYTVNYYLRYESWWTTIAS